MHAVVCHGIRPLLGLHHRHDSVHVWDIHGQSDPAGLPPCAPGRRCRVAASRLEPALDNEIVGDGRAAYTLAVTRHDGGRFIEHVILAHRDGHSTHDTDVEALG